MIELAEDQPVVEHDWRVDVLLGAQAPIGTPPVQVGAFTVSPAHDPSKVWIHRANGEGGRFDRAAFHAHMAKAVEAFYGEHF